MATTETLLNALKDWGKRFTNTSEGY